VGYFFRRIHQIEKGSQANRRKGEELSTIERGCTDYFNADLIESQSLSMRYTRAVLNATGEPLTFGIVSAPPSSKHVAAFLASCGLSMEEQRNFGEETDRKPAMAGFTTAIVPVG